MKYNFFLLVLLFLMAFSSCKEKSDSIYEGCCGVEPTEDEILVAAPDYDNNGNFLDSIVEAHIYIPNVFVSDTSQNLSLNGTFKFYLGKGIYMATDVVYSGENGEVFYHKENFLPNLDDFSDGWNGIKQDGSLHYGKFDFKISLEFLDGQTRTYIGQACSVKCGDDNFPQDNIPNCFFPSQTNGNGELDKNQPGSQHCL